jgi:hypothetical protein
LNSGEELKITFCGMLFSVTKEVVDNFCFKKEGGGVRVNEPGKEIWYVIAETPSRGCQKVKKNTPTLLRGEGASFLTR